jgi:predicted ATP-dependent endonuclease of OLD family
MSNANGTSKKKDTYLQHVSLKNYKSIKDVEIDFKPGLNIIIGKNGSGKTNFFNYLYPVVGINWDKISNSIDAEFSLIKNADIYRIKAKSEFIDNNPAALLANSLKRINAEFFVNNAKYLIKNDDEYSLIYPLGLGQWLNMRSVYHYIKLVKHGIPHDQEVVELPKDFTIAWDKLIDWGGQNLEMKEKTSFIASISEKLGHEFRKTKELNEISAKNIIMKLTPSFFAEINDALKRFTDIGGIRVSPNCNSYRKHNQIYVANFYLEFFINDEWLPYSALSDGSKRLFYIISEILSLHRYEIIIPPEQYSEFGDLTSPTHIILLEEPELGIHPHQLHLLLQFIKEQSREKQIILTTLSPQVLDMLEPDELERIIIAAMTPKMVRN